MKVHSIYCKVRLWHTMSNKQRMNGGNNMLETVYEEYNRYIYHLCLKLTRNTVEAEDLMQEVWVKVVRYESYVQNVDHVKAWLTTITMNTFRDRYRKNVRRSKYMMHQPEALDVPVLDLVPNNDLSTEEKVEQDVMSTIVQTKVNELDTIYKTTLWYFYVDQYSLAEISNLMKVSIGTVKSRLFRAKARLKEILLSDRGIAETIMPA